MIAFSGTKFGNCTAEKFRELWEMEFEVSELTNWKFLWQFLSRQIQKVPIRTIEKRGNKNFPNRFHTTLHWVFADKMLFDLHKNWAKKPIIWVIRSIERVLTRKYIQLGPIAKTANKKGFIAKDDFVVKPLPDQGCMWVRIPIRDTVDPGSFSGPGSGPTTKTFTKWISEFWMGPSTKYL